MTGPEQLQQAEAHLSAADAVMKDIIAGTGPCTLAEGLSGDPLRRLVGAIIAQQISVHAARSIQERVMDLFDRRLSASKILAADEADLREAGLSSQKIRYIRDLADNVRARRLRLGALEEMDDDEVIERLTRVKGIGVWTAQMFLIFRLGRLDVLPVDDLGLLEGARILYELPERPDADGLRELAEPWSPYRSVGCWYLWQGRRAARGDALR